MTPIRFSAGLLVAVSLAIAPPPTSAARQLRSFAVLYAFGDSLADTGNLFIATAAHGIDPAIPPSTSPHRAYYRGRFSNGPVAFEYLSQLLAFGDRRDSGGLAPSLGIETVPDRGGVSFAFGGSGTSDSDLTPGGFPVPGLKGQVDLFRAALAGRTPPSRALYAIISGAGDYLRPAPLDPSQSVGNIADAIRMLYAVGARDVMVLNLPDLGAIPLTAGTPQSSLLTALTLQHNAALAARLRELAASLPGINLVGVDVNAFLQRIPPAVDRTLPAMDALLPPGPGEPPASRCLFIDPASCRDVPTFDVGLRYLFWDAEHPTTAAHGLLGLYLYSLVAIREQ